MQLPEIKTPYVPAADEPSPFLEHPHALPKDTWGEWFKRTVIFPTHRAWIDEKYPDRKGKLSNAMPVFGIDELVQQGWKNTLKAVEETLANTAVFRQPEHPPEMFVEGTRVIRLAWVMDYAVRMRITPYEAMKEGNLIKAKVGKTLQRQNVYLTHFEEWLSWGNAQLRYRMVTDQEQETFSDFDIVMGPLSKTIVVNRRVGIDGRIAQPEVSIWILDGEAIANFTNENHFSENDLRRLISMFQISIGLLPNERRSET